MPVRRLYLLRHAKSSWEQPGLADLERPLAKRGRKACKLIAAHLAEREITPTVAIVSPARRAQQTFDRVRKGLPDDLTAWTEPRAYGASADQLLELLRELPVGFRSALLVGHNPGVQALAVTLAGDGDRLARLRRKYPTAALATLSFAAPWLELRPGAAELEDFVRPKDLE